MLDKNIDLNGKNVLVTGAAGFIGSNLTMELLKSVENIHIIAIDNMNDYYDVSLKEFRMQQIEELEKQVRAVGFHGSVEEFCEMVSTGKLYV